MREHLFKAQRLDTKEWVEGYYLFVEEQNKHYILSGKITFYSVDFSHPFLKTKGFEWFEVDPETVCEFTGLLDKNGKKIWENDIVRLDFGNRSEELLVCFGDFEADCSYDKYIGWYLKEKSYKSFKTESILNYNFEYTKIEVIGNKFD